MQNQKRDESFKRTQENVKYLRQKLVEQKGAVDSLQISAGRVTKLSQRISSVNQNLKALQTRPQPQPRTFNSHAFSYSIGRHVQIALFIVEAASTAVEGSQVKLQSFRILPCHLAVWLPRSNNFRCPLPE